MWKLDSPEGRLKIVLRQKADGSLSYSVEKDGRPVLDESALGIAADIGEFTQGLVFEKQETDSIRESYSLPAGKKARYHNNAEELSLYFRLGDIPFILRARAYDEGAALRYEIPECGGKALLVKYETTEFNFPRSYDKLWLQDWVNTYEGTYDLREWDGSLDGQDYGMPALFHSSAEGGWTLVGEANVLNTNGSYCSCHLKGGRGRKMRLAFAPEEKGRPIESPLPFRSPWRFVVSEDSLDALVNATLNYNLNPPAVIEDTSWIKPGRALWAWWEHENGAQLYTESRSYVDFAAAMGFEAVTLDCAWDASWLQDFCEYAHQRNVQVWLWTGMQRIDTFEKANRLIPLWAGWGVDGLKVDFFDSDSRHTMGQYNMIADLMIKHRLMINFHGSTKPMGEGRTWPNFMTAEGILGLEHYKWSDLPDARHNCTVPFTRNALGPMDYTPTGFSNDNRNTTYAHQLALPVVFDSGVQHYSLSLCYLEAWDGTRFLRRTLPHYDGVRVLSGFPGDHAAILRWAGEKWLIGVITVKKRTMVLKLDFLPEGEFEAEIFEDDRKGEMLETRRVRVGRNDVLELALLAGGGAGIYIAREIKEPEKGECHGYMSSRYTEYPASGAKPVRGSEPARYGEGDDRTGLLLIGGAEFGGCGVPADKRYTIRLFYSAQAPWELSLTDGQRTATAKLPASKGNKVFMTHELTMPLEKGESRLVLNRLSGAVPCISKMRIIDNDPPETVTIGAEMAILTKGELIKAETGEYEAAGLGNGAEMLFDNVYLPQGGKYILRIDYCAGENRDISIEANGAETVQTYLHSTGDWDFPIWDRPGSKEVLIELREGKNTIRLYNDRGPMAHIRGIALSPDDRLL